MSTIAAGLPLTAPSPNDQPQSIPPEIEEIAVIAHAPTRVGHRGSGGNAL
jgi:hypothetical protein